MIRRATLTASGLAVPLIAFAHAHGGFPTVLGAAAVFGLIIFGCAAAFFAVASGGAPRQPAPAE